MLRFLSRIVSVLAVCFAVLSSGWAQQTPKVTLDFSETIFSVLAAMNACGYDQEVGISAPTRHQVRAQVTEAVRQSPEAAAVLREMCAFYRDHQQAEASRDLAQYLSLALNLGEPPSFTLTVKEADLPPDAQYVLGWVPLLKRFYAAAGLHQIWLRHDVHYEELIERFHQPVADLLLSTDVYLKLPIGGYLGRRFVIYVEPMAAPGQVNSRNYGADYFMVVSPERGALKLDQVRHAYLHFVLDPFAMKRANSMKRLAPLLEAVSAAPMDDSFKQDASLLVTESLIRAIEARTLPGGKAAEKARQQAIDRAVAEGFILARHFNEQLVEFEKGPVGLKDSYPDWLFSIDVGQERKRAAQVQFAGKAAPEVVQASKPKEPQLLDAADQKLSLGDVAGAQKLAQQVLHEKRENPGRALFILAKASIMSKDIEGARQYFERALGVAQESNVLAWSHIYLGRIFDLQENRPVAVQHYQAALAAGDQTPETRAAAQRGLEKPYAPPASARKENEENEDQQDEPRE